LNAHFSGLVRFFFHGGLALLKGLKAGCEDGAQLGAQTVVLRSPRHACAVGVQKHSDGGGKGRMREFAGHLREANGHTGTGGNAELALSDIEHAWQHGAAAGEHTAGAESFNNRTLAQAFFDEVNKFAGAGLKDFGEGLSISISANCGTAVTTAWPYWHLSSSAW
jgi:hypothetical protein